MLFARAATVLQQQLAAAVIELAADIECEARETGHSINGVYRLKLEGGSITASFERYHSTRKVHNLQTVVQS